MSRRGEAGYCRDCRGPIKLVRTLVGKMATLEPDPDRDRGNWLQLDDARDVERYGGIMGRWVQLGQADAARERDRRDLFLHHRAVCPGRRRRPRG
jgi:hypothetical protein